MLERVLPHALCKVVLRNVIANEEEAIFTVNYETPAREFFRVLQNRFTEEVFHFAHIVTQLETRIMKTKILQIAFASTNERSAWT